MDQRAANMQARRDKIIAAAETLIMRNSLGSFTMRDLAEEVGLSVKPLYNLCGDKFAIAAEVEERAYTSLEDELLSLPEHVDPIEQAIAIMLAGANKAIARKAVLHHLWRGDHPMSDQKKPRSKGLVKAGSVLVARALVRAIQQDILLAEMDPQTVANQLSINWFGTAMLWSRDVLSDDAFRVRVRYSGLIGLLPFAYESVAATLRAQLFALQSDLPHFDLS